jgi:hypothetical protein
MAAITTRETGTTGVEGVTRKDAPLSNVEIDNNFISLNNNKLESDWTGNTSLVTLGTVTTGTWNATTIATNHGGTGQTTYTNGQLLIGNSTGNTLSKATLTGTTNQVIVTNGAGSITLSTPQSIAITSNVQFNSIGVNATPSGTPGEIRATNEITAFYSDERLKQNIRPIESPIEKVMQLRGVMYEPNSIAESFGYKKQNMVGVIAQDVEKVLPEAVRPAPFDIMLYENTEMSRSGEHYKTVQYEKLVPLLIEAIKELNKEIKEIKGIK